MSWNLWNQEGFKNMLYFQGQQNVRFVGQGKMIMITLSKATSELFNS